MNSLFPTLELALLWGVPKMTILRWAKAEHWASEKRQGKGGGMMWRVCSMPEKRQASLRFAVGCKQAEEAASKQAAQPVNTKAGLCHNLNGLKEAHQLEAQAKAYLVNACIQISQATGRPITAVREEMAALFRLGQAPVPEWVCASIKRISRCSLYEWHVKYAEKGTRALAQGHEKRAPHSPIERSEKLKTFCLGMLERYPHISGISLHDHAESYFGPHSPYADATVKIPSQRRFQSWLKRWKENNAALFLDMQNPDAWRSAYKFAFGNAAAHVVSLNQEWQADSTKADLILSDGKRHNIVAMIDVYSRRVMFHVSRSSSAAAVAACFRKALLAWGVPQTLKTDNGSDYVSQHMQRVLGVLGVQHAICPPFTPEAKPHVERVFKTFLHSIVETLPGYVGHNVADRTAIEARKSFASRLFDKSAPVELPLSPEELQALCDKWADHIYGEKPHGGLEGQTPNARAAAFEGAVARIEDERALDVLLLPCPGGSGLRTVTKKGIRLTNKQHGLSLGGYYIGTDLTGLEGRTVLVRMVEDKPGLILLFDPENQSYLGKAEHPGLAGLTSEDVRNAAVSAERKQKAALSRQRKATRQAAKMAGLDEISKIRINAATAAHEGQEAPAASYTTPYTTEELQQARRVLTGDFAPPTEEEQARIAATVAAFIEPQQQTGFHLPESMQEKLALWEGFNSKLLNGENLTKEIETWCRRFSHLEECKAYCAIHGITQFAFA